MLETTVFGEMIKVKLEVIMKMLVIIYFRVSKSFLEFL